MWRLELTLHQHGACSLSIAVMFETVTNICEQKQHQEDVWFVMFTQYEHISFIRLHMIDFVGQLAFTKCGVKSAIFNQVTLIWLSVSIVLLGSSSFAAIPADFSYLQYLCVCVCQVVNYWLHALVLWYYISLRTHIQLSDCVSVLPNNCLVAPF